jgi:hypothetical protein
MQREIEEEERGRKIKIPHANDGVRDEWDRSVVPPSLD